MLAAARRVAAGQLLGAMPASLVASLQVVHQPPAPAAAAAAAATCSSRGLSASPSCSSSAAAVPEAPSHHIVASNTPVTRRLWQRFQWTMEKLAAAPPRDPAAQPPKPPRPVRIKYPFSSDEQLREHYRSPWNEARIGRILEDLDSLAGYVAFEHNELEGEATRPPLCVTASVETIELHSSRLHLDEDMEMSGRVVWTGSSSMDVHMELEQGGERQVSALFTFVARDVVTNKSHPVVPLVPRTKQDQEIFCERQRASLERRRARAASGSGGSLHRALHQLSPEAERWAEALLAAGKNKADLPALAAANLLLVEETAQRNVFTCQPQNRNIHGRVFGGFLMRRAFELAHSTAYLFAGCRPLAVEVEEVSFLRPVNVGDLMKLRAWVVHTWVAPADPARGLAYIKVEASVTQPEKRQSVNTNAFDLIFSFDLEKGPDGRPRPPKMVLPSTEQQALELARLFGPGSGREHLRHPMTDGLAAAGLQ